MQVQPAIGDQLHRRGDGEKRAVRSNSIARLAARGRSGRGSGPSKVFHPNDALMNEEGGAEPRQLVLCQFMLDVAFQPAPHGFEIIPNDSR